MEAAECCLCLNFSVIPPAMTEANSRLPPTFVSTGRRCLSLSRECTDENASAFSQGTSPKATRRARKRVREHEFATPGIQPWREGRGSELITVVLIQWPWYNGRMRKNKLAYRREGSELNFLSFLRSVSFLMTKCSIAEIYTPVSKSI